MIVNHIARRGPLESRSISPADLRAEQDALEEAGFALRPGLAELVLAARRHDRFAELTHGTFDPDGPRHDEAEIVRLERKGKTLLEHCLDQASHFCITGFLDHESRRRPGGRNFVFDFIPLLVTERMVREGEEARLVDRMLAEAVDQVFGLPAVERDEG